MPSEARMKSELDVLKAMVPQSCKEIISLTESWLERKVPEKKEVKSYTLETGGKYDCSTNKLFVDGWNSAIDACRLASVVSEEEILEIVKGATIKWDCAVPSENWGYEKSVAHAIAEYANRNNKGE